MLVLPPPSALTIDPVGWEKQAASPQSRLGPRLPGALLQPPGAAGSSYAAEAAAAARMMMMMPP